MNNRSVDRAEFKGQKSRSQGLETTWPHFLAGMLPTLPYAVPMHFVVFRLLGVQADPNEPLGSRIGFVGSQCANCKDAEAPKCLLEASVGITA